MANISKNIKQFRIKKKLTQDQLAEQPFVSRQSVSDYENNKSNPDIDMLVKIAEVLETDVNTLIYGEPEQIHRKEQIRRMLFLVITIILFGIVVFLGHEFLQDFRKQDYDSFPLMAYNLTVMALFYLTAGWTCMELFFFFFKVQSIRRVYAKWMNYIVISLLVLYVILILPYLIWQIQY